MKKTFAFLSSMLFTGILITVFGISIAYATFIENDYGTQTAKILIYNSLWFEILLFIMIINMVGSIMVNKLWGKKKWSMFLFHVAFIIILVGAAVTRYFGYEGSMHIREGASSSTLVSESTYISIHANKNGEELSSESEVRLSGYTGINFNKSISISGEELSLEALEFIPSSVETVVEDETGSPILSLIAVGSGMQRDDFTLKHGENKQVQGLRFGFGSQEDNLDVVLYESGGKIIFTSQDTIIRFEMMGSQTEKIAPGIATILNDNIAFKVGEISFGLKKYIEKGRSKLVYQEPEKNTQNPDGVHIQVRSGGASKDLFVFGYKGAINKPYTATINGIEVAVSYGSKLIQLPFEIQLNDFQLERYPGSMSPSSYASEVTLIDKNEGLETPYRIFMNNILKYKGYRFFQSSFDRDEKGTILSVNHDFWGTFITYFGYLIMVLGMVFTLFNKNSRFKRLVRASSKLRLEKAKYLGIFILGMFIGTNSFAQNPNSQQFDELHIKKFSELLIQTNKGRIEPVNTIASQIIRKTAKKSTVDGMSATEVFLDMHMHPNKWKNQPIIKVANAELRNMLGTFDDRIALNSLIVSGPGGGYKLQELVRNAYEKKPALRTKFDKEVINVDERVNILMGVFSGEYLTLFPIPGHQEDKWVGINQTSQLGAEAKAYAEGILKGYFTAVENATANGNWAEADKLLLTLKEYQLAYGNQVIPSTGKIKLEVFYINFHIFGKLAKFYLFTGLLFLLLVFISLFNSKYKFRFILKILSAIIIFLFAAHTFGLAMRWYISGHAPWSNGYESMLFVGWATCLAGLVFANRSIITLALTTILSALTLLVAGMSWMSPEITNLVPVLKSYWLIVHVAIITASYGFLAIASLLGMLNLILMLFRTPKNITRLNITIKELVYIIEMALIIGLFMLTVGSFLGGVWANESWGRYWGWDPKETWALVTILVYSFIVHMHRIPGFKGHFQLSAAALVGFSSVLMTYFGVNYYLSGLHSYAQGEAMPIPMGVYIGAASILVLIGLAALSESKVKNQGIVIMDDL